MVLALLRGLSERPAFPSIMWVCGYPPSWVASTHCPGLKRLMASITLHVSAQATN